MRMKLLWAALLAVPMLVAALVYGRTLIRCHPTDASSVTAENTDKSECCQADDSDCCQTGKESSTPNRTVKTGAQQIDPDRQIVFKVEGLTCPAVKGIGCGHMLRPVLASLDKIDGVEASAANYTGTMLRISVTTAADRDKVVEGVRKTLAETNRKSVVVAGDERKRSLEKEQWREAGRIGELSAIEFRTMVLHRVKTFAQAEKLDKAITDKLLEMAEEQWERLAREAAKDGTTQPEDWGSRCKKSLPVFLERAKEVLTAEQVERFRKTLTTPCRDEDRPEAPPASSSAMTCRLTPDELKAQRTQLIPGLFHRAEKVEDISDGLRFRFAHRPGLVTELAAIIEKERVCCSFLNFRLITEKGEGPIILEITGPPSTAGMLRKL